ncbi:MAG: phytoene/squalene synthase family protein [Verrucomicrobiota bacterium JB025]|nr:squalene/phytoene synthase family protein [Verrucomicrobiota bacterium JB025]
MLELLKGVSRSFYLSLRLLPGAMRSAASLGYLLARASDTLADSGEAGMEGRVLFLDWFERSLAGEEEPPRWPLSFLNSVADRREKVLLESVGDLIRWVGGLRAGEAELVRGVVTTIIGGQKLDLERFGNASGDSVVVLESPEELEDYAFRVAGCVGEFWTRLGFLTMGEMFSREAEEELVRRGIVYGNGLQLVNILRDLPADLEQGRCYLPGVDPDSEDALLAAHGEWLERAAGWVAEGREYTSFLVSRRLRAASVLPAMIAEETLDLLRGVSRAELDAGVKVPRSRVYFLLARALAGR